jgi:hypothetical protein
VVETPAAKPDRWRNCFRAMRAHHEASNVRFGQRWMNSGIADPKSFLDTSRCPSLE